MVLLAPPPATVAGGNSGSRRVRVSSENRNDSRRSGSRPSSSRPRLLEAPPTSYRNRSDRGRAPSGYSARSRSRSLADIPEDSRYHTEGPREKKHSSRSRSPSLMDRLANRMAGIVLGTDLDSYEHSRRSGDGALVRSRTVRDDDYGSSRHSRDSWYDDHGYDSYGSSRRSRDHRGSSRPSRSDTGRWQGEMVVFAKPAVKCGCGSARCKNRHEKPLINAKVNRRDECGGNVPLDVTETQWGEMEQQADNVLYEFIDGRWFPIGMRFKDKEERSRR